MKRTSPSRIALLICAGASALSAVLQTVAVFLNYSTSSNYFDRNAWLPTLAIALMCVGIVAGIVCAILTDRSKLGTTVFRPRISTFPYGIGFLTAAVFAFMNANQAGPSMQRTLLYAAAITLLGGAIYCVLVCIPAARKKADLCVIFGMLGIVGSVLLNAYYYFDTSLEMNAPFKLTTQMGLLCVTVYLTGEMRFLLGNAKPRFFIVLCTNLFSVGSLCALTLPVAFLTDRTERADYAAGAMLVFCTLLSAALRLWTLLSYRPEEPADEVEE